MKKITLMIAITLVCGTGFARSNEVMGTLVRCDCSESSIDGQRSLGKVSNENIVRSEDAARRGAERACANRADDRESAVVTNCTYTKVVDQKVGKGFKRRVERLTDDDENNLHNDLISTL